MNQLHTVTTRFPTAADFDTHRVASLCDLINAVYDEAESGIWKPGGTRTTVDEVERLLRANALILAEIAGVVVGSVSVSVKREGVGEFGMLACDPRQRGKGVGAALIDRAEQWARDNGCPAMQLTLLTPRHWAHPSKEFLKGWYTRLGYRPHAALSLQEVHPELVSDLATECDLTAWRKGLA